MLPKCPQELNLKPFSCHMPSALSYAELVDYVANNINLGQIAPKGAVRPGFILLASMIVVWSIVDYMYYILFVKEYTN